MARLAQSSKTLRDQRSDGRLLRGGISTPGSLANTKHLDMGVMLVNEDGDVIGPAVPG
jgi:hypothetical protein